MPARHLAFREPNRSRRRRVLLSAGVALLAVGIVAADVLAGSHHRSSAASDTRPGLAVLAPTVGAKSHPSASPSALTTIAVPSARVETRPGDDPVGELDSLTAGVGASGVSVAAVNLTTGASFTYGATSGMTMGSIAKLDTLETLLLQHEDAHATLSDDEVTLATAMIENSDNDAADALWADIGSDPAVTAANQRLGVPGLVVGTGGYWGLGTTAATDQVTLLKNLVATGGPLDAASQQFALSLMDSVEADQRWGVGTIADAGTTFANKNGWLANDSDNDLWLINSDGLVTVGGQQIAISVLTQHDDSMADGITLVEQIAAAVAPAVSSAAPVQQ